MSLHTFTVEGHEPFPFDMLRYDRATPKTEQDSTLLGRSTRHSRIPTRITLIAPRPPTTGRWKSYGWHVLEEETHG